MTAAGKDDRDPARREGARRGPGGARKRGHAPRSVWLEAGVIACACPDCGSPMSIRLWLRVADCWRCGAGVELSEAQQREAHRLLRQAEPPALVSAPPQDDGSHEVDAAAASPITAAEPPAPSMPEPEPASTGSARERPSLPWWQIVPRPMRSSPRVSAPQTPRPSAEE
jgi:hypothetical protein